MDLWEAYFFSLMVLLLSSLTWILRNLVNQSQYESLSMTDTPTSSKKRSVKPLRFVVEDPIYNFSYCVSAGGTSKEACEHYQLPNSGDDTEKSGVAGMVMFKEGHSAAVIWFPDRKVHFLTVTHEAIHAILVAFNERGVTAPCCGSDEHFTYHHDWLVTELVKRLEVEYGIL